MAASLLHAWGLSQLPAPTHEPREVLADYIYVADPALCQLASHTVTLSGGHPTTGMPCVTVAPAPTGSLFSGGGGGLSGGGNGGARLLLRPRSVFPDPLRGAPHLLVVCDAVALPYKQPNAGAACAKGRSPAAPTAPAAFAPECLFLDPLTGVPRPLPAADRPVNADCQTAAAAAAALLGGGERAALLAAAGLRRQQAAEPQPQPQPQPRWRPVEWGALAGGQPCAGRSNNVSGSSSSTAAGGLSATTRVPLACASTSPGSLQSPGIARNTRTTLPALAPGVRSRSQDHHVTSALAAVTRALGLPVLHAAPSAAATAPAGGGGALRADRTPSPEPSGSVSDGSDGSFGSGGGAQSHDMLVSAILRLDRSLGKRQRTLTGSGADGSELRSGGGTDGAHEWRRRRLRGVARREEEEDTASSALSSLAPGTLC